MALGREITMPTKLPIHRPPGHKTKKEKHKQYDDRRGSAHSRGYTAQWRKARLLWLNQYPLCGYCEIRNMIVEATVVDHIIPHKGDMQLFWNKANWQSLCKTCHNRKTMRELNDKPMEIYLICGPAGSGKSTFVRKNKKQKDLVYDYDKIYEAFTLSPMKESRVDCVNLMVRIRRFVIELIAQQQECFKDIRRMWFISTEANNPRRARLAADIKATRVFVLETSFEQCLENVKTSDERNDSANKIKELAGHKSNIFP